MVRQVLGWRWWLRPIRSERFRLGWTKLGCELEPLVEAAEIGDTWIWSIGVQAA